jgi:hypothetical protein
MRRILLALILSFLAVPAMAQQASRPLGQIPLLRLGEVKNPDIEALLELAWPKYWRQGGEFGFGPNEVRVGRFDLDDDDQAELFAMVDKPNWEATYGKPFVVATWSKKGWGIVGWGWGDEDGVFALTDVALGWHSIDTQAQVLEWNGRTYVNRDK